MDNSITKHRSKRRVLPMDGTARRRAAEGIPPDSASDGAAVDDTLAPKAYCERQVKRTTGEERREHLDRAGLNHGNSHISTFKK
jgi:hypothetical protein